MQTVTEFLKTLARQGVKLSVEAGQLNCYAPSGALTSEMRKEILRYKPEILALLEKREKQANVARRTASQPVEFPLSAGQKGLYILQQINPAMTAYNLPLCVRINGAIDFDVLEKAWSHTLDQYPILSARITESGGTLVHHVDEHCRTKIRRQQVSFSDHAGLIAFLRQRVKQPFDLDRGPLSRIEVLTLSEGEHILLLTIHHMIFDGVSAVVLLRSLLAACQSLSEGKPPAGRPERTGYEQFVAWENAMLASAEGRSHSEYWQQRLSGELPSIELFPDVPRLSAPTFEGASFVDTLSPELSQTIRELARDQATLPSIVFLAAFKLLLHRYTSQDDIIVGMPVIVRPGQKFASEIGYFINMVPLRTQCSDQQRLSEFLRDVRKTMLDAIYHSSYPFELMLDKLRTKSSTKNAVFQVNFAYQNFIGDDSFASIPRQPGLEIENVAEIGPEGYSDLGLEIFEKESVFSVHVRYNPDLYSSAAIERFCRHYATLLESLCRDGDRRLHEYSMISVAEKRKLLVELNDTAAEFPRETCIHDFFAEQVAAGPDRTAVVLGDEKLTYRELYDKVSILALFLQSHGIGPDRIAGLCVERSLEMMLGIMGTVVAGGAYLPLDPDYPDERLTYMMQDSQAAVVLTQEKFRGRIGALAGENAAVLCLDSQWPEIVSRVAALEAGGVALRRDVKAGDVCYVIYTSGSTGKPKGALIEHRALVNRLHWMQKAYRLDDSDVVLQKTPYSFDVSVWEFFWPMMTGASLVFAVPGGHKDVAYLQRLIGEAGVTTLHFVPSMLRAYLDHAEEACPSVRRIFASGEALDKGSVDRYRQKFPNGVLHNLYGPTEAAIDVSYYDCSELPYEFVPIGKPIDNIQLYILDAYNQPLPIGVPGELHIAGVGLARGYLNRPELTREKFVANPFGPGARMYKTGDLACWMPDGNIQYLGRIDTQIKIRGFRVEIGEIEARLNQFPGILDSAVIARGQDADKQLVAFYRAKDSTSDRLVQLPADELRAHLLRTLPDYMVPSAFVSVAAIPLSSNGKVDRRALSRMEITLESAQEYVAPRNETEKQLVAIWAQVLGVAPEKIGVNDSFFELGGHSLRAAQLIARIRTQLGVDIPLKAFFEGGSVAQMARFAGAAPKSDVRLIERVDRAKLERLPLSFAQERLWFIDQLEPGSAGYNLPGAVTIRGPLDVDQLDAAFNRIIERHDTLRTVFPSEEGQAVQRILDSVEFRLERFDLAGIEDAAERNAEARRLCRTDAAAPFDLAHGPLVRGRILRLAGDEHVLMLNMHHIISDGWSIGVLVNEIRVILEALQNGRDPELPPLPIQYADYSVWQRRWLEEEGVLEKQLGYWKSKLAGMPESLDLAADFPRPAVQTFEGATRPFLLDAQLTSRLRHLAEQEGGTLFMLLLAAFNVLLHRYSGQDDLCVGTPIANRQYGQTDGLIGMFVNTLAMRNHVSGEDSFVAFLEKVKTTCLEAYDHQDAPFEKIVDLVSPHRNMAISPLFQVMLILQNVDMGSPDGRIQRYPVDTGISKFDLTFELAETAEGLAGSVEYCTALYKPQTIERMIGHFQELCRSIVAAPESKIGALQYLSEAEKRKLLVELNDTAADYPKDRCIHELFEAHVEEHGERTAVVYGDRRLTYRALYERSRELALYLQAAGVGPDGIVGLCVERSLEMMIGIMGTVMAGGAYMPLDPDYPDDRLTYMLADSNASVVLTQHKWASRIGALSGDDKRIVSLDAEWNEVQKARGGELRRDVRPGDLCYVIYTSGSTGRPKGVLNEHGALVNRLNWMQKMYPLSERDVVLQKTPYSFDVSVWEFFWPMMTGASVVFAAPGGHKDVGYLEELIDEAGVTTLHYVPSMLYSFLENAKGECRSVRQVFCSGEALDRKGVERYRTRFPNAALHNLYGPTEAAIDVTYYDCTKLEYPFVPIGAPIDNIQIHILDRYGQLQPIGMPGELHIAGVGLARGYLNRPELTEEKFVSNPFCPGARMYRTGDLASWLEDGNVQYLGRIDTQVKVRGFRIELGEIEARLAEHAQIVTGAVVARGEGAGKQLVAFYTSRDGAEIEAGELRGHLQQTLPEYMVPAAFVRLETIPLSANGKVDRRALASLEVRLGSARESVAPRTETERQLVEIWSDVLGVAPERIGVNAGFFELGGHSLLATQLMSKVRSRFGVELPLRSIFERTTVEQFAELLGGAERREVPAVTPADRTQYENLPLSFAQERLWFLNQLEPESAGYNIPGAIRIHGALDARQLEAAFNRLIERHESLRTVFPSGDGEPRQQILERMEFSLETIDLGGESEEARQEKAQQICQREARTPFDLANGPLFRGKVIRLGTEEHLLLVNMHHIISDGWSLGVMIRDLGTIVEALRNGREPELPPLAIQYADYAVWQRRRLEEEGVLSEQLAYWQKKLAGLPESLDLATDYARPSVQSFEGATREFLLDAALVSELKGIGERQGGTLYMVLVAAFKALLHRYTGQSDICIGSPIANRQYGETEGLIGMFVNTLALRDEVRGEETFAALLEKVKTTCLEAYEHQEAPFERVVDAVHPQRNLAISPLFQIMLVLQNMDLGGAEAGIERYPLDSGISKFDLTISFTETPEGLNTAVEYCTALYKPQTIERMIEHYRELCRAIVAAPEAKIGELQYLSEGEKQKLLVAFNDTRREYPADECLHELFVAQAGRDGDRVAAVCGEARVTYRELNEKSQELALYLQSQGVQPDRLVGVCMDRSLDMLVAMLGILQAGGAYVPLDPNYPNERLAYMVRDSRAAIVITERKLLEQLSALMPPETQLIALDERWEAISRRVVELRASGARLEHDVRPNHLAYVIYTSGSTGNPKGVAIEHHSPVTLVHWAQEVYSGEELAGVLAATSICFDLSIYEIFLTLAVGGTVILVPNALGLANLANPEAVTLINTVPSAGEELVRLGVIPRSVRTINLAGEPLPARLVDRIYDSTSVGKVYDLYGPSEDTTYSTYVLRRKNGPQTIGRPVANTQVYILDRHQQLQPIGIPGELHIAGDGLARGYLYRPELTEEKFVANPFEPGTRMYKTGDLARWQDDGTLQYLGRIDTQVKVRGFRIEMGEIEARLLEHPAIADGVVIAQGEGATKQLIAFYRAQETTAEQVVQIAADDLRGHLLRTLPEYMVPSAFVGLAAIPLNPNGKVDRRALSRIDVTAVSGREYAAPRNETERQLVAIWSEVLMRAPESVGVHDNFFELGGHSLLATQLVSKIRSRMEIDLPLKALFEASSVAALAERIATSTKSAIPTIRPVERTQYEHLPLSFAQERLWFINQLEPESPGYNLPEAVVIRGALDVDQLEQAFNLIIDRHESLRTVFPTQNGEARQKVLEHREFRLERVDLRHWTDATARDEETRRLCQQEAARLFDLANGPLLRGMVIRRSEDEHVLMLAMHHIVSDGWSFGVLIRELRLILEALQQGRRPELPALPIQYVDYSVWQREWLEAGGVLQRQLGYWQTKLAGAPESLDLPMDHPRPAVQNVAGASRHFTLDADLTARLRRLAERQGATLYMVLLAAFNVLLHRYSGQNDLCVGSPIANRQYGETEGLIGMFVNTLALRTQIEGDETLDSLLEKVRATCLEAYEHQDTPFEKIVDALRLQRNLAISPLFQVMLILQNADMGTLTDRIQRYPLDGGISKFELIVELTETAEGLAGSLRYRTALFETSTIERMVRHLTGLIRAIAAAPGARISELDYLDEDEKRRLLVEFNATRTEYPAEICAHDLFAERVAMHPDQMAVVYGDESLTYAELYRRSCDLAACLRAQGVRPDSRVGLFVERSLDMAVGLFGILQAGGAYVPLDPDYPVERLRYMLEDSAPAIVLTQQHLEDRLPQCDVPVIALDRDWSVIEEHARTNPNGDSAGTTPDHLAYVIYTSGSTGVPKGVMVRHGGVVNLRHALEEAIYAGHADWTRVSVNASFSFDSSVKQFIQLLSGRTLILVPQSVRLDADALLRFISHHRIDVFDCTPSQLNALLDAGMFENGRRIPRAFLIGGEAIDARLWRALGEHADTAFFNVYGPAECTVDATVARITPDDPIPNIGRPVANARIYILDDHGAPVPIGVVGEICIGGAGVARGYLGRPDLTAERFVADPFAGEGRLYRTGDLGRWRADGAIEFAGRNDDQVKLRGQRIELGEIETQLAKHPAVREAVVVAREDEPGEKRLVAYVTNAGQSAGAEELRAYLLARLPQYMVPAAFVELESLPLTPNKKVDRRALPKPEAEAFVRREFVPPQGETESALAEIWQQLLRVERMGRNDDFFELGGHSLSAVQLMARINARFRQMLPLAVLFQAPTIASFARLLSGDQKASFDILVSIQPEGDALPVFAIPGVGGNVLSLRPLRHAVGHEQPLYALQAAGLDGLTAPSASVEETARMNIAAMKSVQPAGPYSLIGHSYGGAVAYEMARILLEQGEPVSSLVLLDSVAPAIFQKNPAPDEITELMEAGQAVADVYGETLSIDRQQFGSLPPGERLEYLTALLRERGLEIDARQFAAFFNVYRANHECYRKYVPGPVRRAISVTLYRATLGREERRSLAPDYGWNALLPSPIRTVDVDADHFTILEKVPLRAGAGARADSGALEPSAGPAADVPDVVPTT